MPAPFVVRDLAHPSLDVSLDWFVGRLAVNPGLARTHSFASLVRVAMEANVFIPRRLYLGATFPIGFALPPDGGLAKGEAARPEGERRFTGNFEAHIRTVFALPTWLEIGFELGIMAPTSIYDREYRPNRSASDAIGTLDPTNYIDFLPGRVGLRPAADLRIRRGDVIFQGRHGLDVLVDNQGIEKATVAGRLLAHVGYLARPDLEVSLEATQVYIMTSDDEVSSRTDPERVFANTYRIRDGNRSSITIGPAIRAMTHDFDYGVSMITNLSDPLSPVTDGFVGLRFGIIAHAPTK